MKNLSLLIFILISNLSVAQIDTTNWYPLQTGNTWQFSYYNFFGEYFDITIEVIGDTVINEKEYYILNSGRNDYFQRVENNEFVYEYSPYSNQEYVRYDFVSPDKSIWDLDSIGGQYGIYESRERYIKIYGDSLQSKIYNSAYISYRSTDPDTSWGPFVDGSAVALSKGLGITEYQQGASSGNFMGAVINGDTLGTVTSVAAMENYYKQYHLEQNYPNPFNPSTTLKFSLPKRSFVSLKVYDMLGREVAILINDELEAGVYEKQFNGTGLTSGIYICSFRTKDFHQSNKMILLK